MSDKIYGATPLDWHQFAYLFDLQEDLLPVVSNPNRKISAGSAMLSVGKTPSVINHKGMVLGIPKWTSRKATSEDIVRWSKESDYGICVIGRTVKAIDIDIPDADISNEVISLVDMLLCATLPIRYRDNSGKKLLAFRLPVETRKRVIRTAHGIIELLGDKQQFIAAGTHTSGSRYEWDYRGHDDIPELTEGQLDAIWSELQRAYGTEPERKVVERKAVSTDLDDPVFVALEGQGLIKSQGRDGSYNIICPFECEHTTESSETATVYYPPHTGGYAISHIKCLHAHCADRTVDEWKDGLGIGALDLFDDVSADVFVPPEPQKVKTDPSKFKVIPAVEFAMSGSSPKWLIKNLIPEKAIVSVFGASQTGKTFAVFDMIASIARGVPWRESKTRQGTVVYVCAEGEHFFKNRIRAYLTVHDLQELKVFVVPAQPNLMKESEVRSLVEAIRIACGDLCLVVVDTYAACMVGDENSGSDVGKVLSGCKLMRDELNASVVMVHHSGKDASKGARGWSGLKAAVDSELQVVREGKLHAVTVTKQKDGPDGGQYGFSLKSVDLGVDDDGDTISSCVVEHTNVLPLLPVEPGQRVNPKEAATFTAISMYFEDFDMYPTVDQLVSYVGDREGCRPGDIERAIKKLESSGKILITADNVVNPLQTENKQ